MNRIEVDEDLCISCRKCYEVCWMDVIRWNEENDKPLIRYPKDCVECNFCEISCPTEAIKVVIDYERPFPEPYLLAKSATPLTEKEDMASEY